MSTDWGQIAGRVASAYVSGGASEGARYGGGGGGSMGGGGGKMTEGNRFGPVILGTGMSKISATISQPVGDVMPGMGDASGLMGLDGAGLSLGGQRLPWLWVLLGLGVVWAIKQRKS